MALAAARDFVVVTGEEHLGQHFQPMRISFSPNLTPAAGVLCSYVSPQSMRGGPNAEKHTTARPIRPGRHSQLHTPFSVGVRRGVVRGRGDSFDLFHQDSLLATRR